MSIDLTSEDEKAIGYILDWWRIHPDEVERMDRLDDRAEMHEYRAEVYDKINAVTEGDLETIVEKESLSWVYLFGFAASVSMKEGL